MVSIKHKAHVLRLSIKAGVRAFRLAWLNGMGKLELRIAVVADTRAFGAGIKSGVKHEAGGDDE